MENFGQVQQLVRQYKAASAMLTAMMRQAFTSAEIALTSAAISMRAPIEMSMTSYDGFTYPDSDLDTFEHIEMPEVTEYEPGKYSELSLVHTKVIEKVGHKWRKRTYWRIAGEKIHGRYDYIRCDGPAYPTKETCVPANFRRAKSITKGIKEREGKREAQSQIKRNKIASVPLAIRFGAAVRLKKRLDEQAEKAFRQGNIPRYDTLDNRASTVHAWLIHVAVQFPDLAFKRPDKAPQTDRQRLQADIKAMPKTYRVKSATDRKTATRLRSERIDRQLKWTSRVARTNGAHYSPKSR